ncbi:serine hydrolase domain-containing protein [Virgibacillus sp. 6R]|uniref:serine hydrolase domain-containing protein n=1 Tax=Metabacillus sp. 22489 TaxID=3453928 RepID=UPI0011A7189A
MSDLHSRLTTLLQHFVENGLPGCACMVTKDGKTIYENYLGFADIDKELPITDETIYRIFSMTKVVTCTAALMLYERGLFLLNDPLEEYLPEFKNQRVFEKQEKGNYIERPAANKILVKDLFTMTSGITYPGDANETERMTARAMSNIDQRVRQGEAIDVQTISKIIASIPLAFEPGSQWHYGLSHDVLGAFIEVLSGKTFGQFLKDEIFDPLQMEDTFFKVPENKQHRISNVYIRNEQGKLVSAKEADEAFQIDFPYENGGAGLFSTLRDYNRFAQMLANGGQLHGVQIIGRKTIELMSQNHLTLENSNNYNWDYLKGYGYGLGVRVMENPSLGGINSSIGEFGWSGMLGTWVLIDPKEKLSAVYMQQMYPNLEAYHQPRLRSVIYGTI